MFGRKKIKRAPWWARIFAVMAILPGIYWAERYAPVIRKNFTLEKTIDIGIKLYHKYKEKNS
ncbi:hypothetical protein K8I28_15900 [bacterium]|nr:hypothetical protein [bacterium]